MTENSAPQRVAGESETESLSRKNSALKTTTAQSASDSITLFSSLIAAHPAEHEATAHPAKIPPVQTTDATLSVHTSLLDTLMQMAGELVLSRNQLLQAIGSNNLGMTKTAGHRFHQITSELQKTIILTRRQPLGNIFGRFPRLVRDLARQLNKMVELSVAGEEIEVDNEILDSITFSLTHLMHNAVNHGIETPAERSRDGKDPEGQIVVKAFQEAGKVVIQISDDGGGINGEALAASAVKKGMITTEQAWAMSKREKDNLLFHPGFSMTGKLGEISGCSTGMGMVKASCDKLGGQVEIFTEVGRGTVISVKLPLPHAIIPCQIVTTNGERYAIPIVNTHEFLRIPTGQLRAQMEKNGHAEAITVRGDLIPLIRLADVLGTEHPCGVSGRPEWTTGVGSRENRTEADTRHRLPAVHPGSCDSTLNIVVVATDSIRYGIIVDRLLDSEELLVHPLSGRHLRRCQYCAGAAIMTDGRVALILDTGNITQSANLTAIVNRERSKEEACELRRHQNKQDYLVFHGSDLEQFAVPLHLVNRVEKITSSRIKELGGKRIMHSQGRLISLVSLNDLSPAHPPITRHNIRVIHLSIASRTAGLLVSGDIDVVGIDSRLNTSFREKPGISGTLISHDQAFKVVDILTIDKILFPHRYSMKLSGRPTWHDNQDSLDNT